MVDVFCHSHCTELAQKDRCYTRTLSDSCKTLNGPYWFIQIFYPKDLIATLLRGHWFWQPDCRSQGPEVQGPVLQSGLDQHLALSTIKGQHLTWEVLY